MSNSTVDAVETGDDEMELSSSSPMPSDELLTNLMTALSAGARAVQGIPIEDDFDYQASFPEFQSLIRDNQDDMLDAFVLALSTYNEKDQDLDFQGLTDPLLWEVCGDVCDWLLEQAEAKSVGPNVEVELVAAKKMAKSSFGRLMAGIVNMEKPQDVYNLYFDGDDPSFTGQNNRLRPFVPPITEKFHATCAPLDLTLQPGHGLGDRFGAWRKKPFDATNIVAPAQHCSHVYESELERLEFQDWHLGTPGIRPPKIQSAAGPLDATMVDSTFALDALTAQLETAREIAVDLEAHDFRSFTGITCLIQITIGFKDERAKKLNYLVDPFPLWHQLGNALGPAFTNPNIVKVMHGAESDVQWLQRDFGLYIVNLFDTYCAARALKMKRLGYATLLEHYVGITPDKSHQLSDWRQRPLPPAMKEYAIMDTHYLLDIYQHLKFDLAQHKETSVEQVFDNSVEVSMIRYAPPVFRPDGYRTLMKRQGSKMNLKGTQEKALKEIYDWRDQIARHCDEAPFYVCSNHVLVRLAAACPTTLTALQALVQPMPPLLLRYSKQFLGFVQRGVKPPFFKPAGGDIDEPPQERNRALMSPVLGTEALYRQAGWISPHVEGKSASNQVVEDVVTSATDDDEDGVIKPRRVLDVHGANHKFRSSQFSTHSLQLGQCDTVDGDTDMADGMGPARAVHLNEVSDEAEAAQTNAAQIRSIQKKHAMLGLISSGVDGDADDEQDEEEETTGHVKEEEEFVIPRSMREIYRISNRNRRNKKSSSPLPMEPNDKEAEELVIAEEVLKARAANGKNYFDEIPGTPKRQRTKSTGTASVSSEDATPGHDSGISREEDVAMMQEIGWIKDKEEVDGMMKQGESAGEGEDDGDAAAASSEDEGMKQVKTFDYSAVGPIGAFSATPSANPFFAGAATTGGHLNQQFGKGEPKKKQSVVRGKPSRRQQVERPEKSQGRAQAYKKR